MNKFIIFATARTGSTSLARVLGESSDVKMAIEPFHEGFSKWNPEEKNYSKLIVDSETMNQALDDLFSRYTAIKVLDYQLDPEVYYSMLKRKDFKILFLRRKNIVQSVLSNLVAEKTSEWHKQDNIEIYKNLKPINLDKMSEMIDYVTAMNSENAKFLEKNRKGDYLPLYYEELYSDSLEQNNANLKVICDFLNISLPPEEAIKKYMLPSEAKINYLNIYRDVPNYKEIEQKFGKP
jgi:LPS sulfotransferase NodH